MTRRPTPAEIRADLARLGLKQTAAAEMFGISAQAFRRYLMDPAKPSASPAPLWMRYAMAGIGRDLKPRAVVDRRRAGKS
jgi:hypothetical protein